VSRLIDALCFMCLGAFFVLALQHSSKPRPATVAAVMDTTWRGVNDERIIKAVLARYDRATLGFYEADSNVTDRYRAWISLPQTFVPGDTLVFTTTTARLVAKDETWTMEGEPRFHLRGSAKAHKETK